MEKPIKILRKNLLDFLGKFTIKNYTIFILFKPNMQKPIENLIQTLQKQKKKIISLDELKNLIYKSF